MPIRLSGHAARRISIRYFKGAQPLPHDLVRRLCDYVSAALNSGYYINTPNGLYIPLSLDAVEGYAVVSPDNEAIRTVLPVSWCPEVTRVLKELIYESNRNAANVVTDLVGNGGADERAPRPTA